MKKIDSVVLKETEYIALWVAVLSVLMQAIFLVFSRWDPSVLFGNLLSAFAVILNFFFMALTVQKALEKEEGDAKNHMKLSQSIRFLFLAVVLVIGLSLPCFHSLAVVIPVFFPRIAILFRSLFNRKEG